MRPVGDLTGAAWNGKANVYRVNANATDAIGIGSVVMLTGAADDGLEGLPCVAKFVGELDDSGAGGTAGSVPVGVVVGFQLSTTVGASLDLPQYRAGSTSRLVLVCDDPTALFEIQEDSTGGAYTAANVGLHAALTADTPSATTGYSNQELDTSTAAAGASFPIKVISFARRIDNEISVSYAKLIVKFNKHAYSPVRSAALGGGI
jgi:hypothetical protein